MDLEQVIMLWFIPFCLSAGLPGPCKEILASEITKSSCKVTWDPPDYDGGSPIIHYVLQVRDGSAVLILSQKSPLGLKRDETDVCSVSFFSNFAAT